MTKELTADQTRALELVQRAQTYVTRSNDLHQQRLKQRAARISEALEAGVPAKTLQEEVGLSASTVRAASKSPDKDEPAEEPAAS